MQRRTKAYNSALGMCMLVFTSLSILIILVKTLTFIVQDLDKPIADISKPVAIGISRAISTTVTTPNMDMTAKINSNNFNLPISLLEQVNNEQTSIFTPKTAIKTQQGLFTIDSLKTQRHSHHYKKCNTNSQKDKDINTNSYTNRNTNRNNDRNHDLSWLLSSDHNWASYFDQCKVFGGSLTKDKFDVSLIFPKKLAYIHVFKAGGTTIMRGISDLFESNKFKFNSSDINIIMRNGHNMNISYFEKLMGKKSQRKFKLNVNNKSNSKSIPITIPTTFTFVRDPIKKFLSAFFEINKRILSRHYNNITNYSQSKASKKENLLNFDYIVNTFDHNGTLLVKHWIFEMYQRLQARLSHNQVTNHVTNRDRARHARGSGVHIASNEEIFYRKTRDNAHFFLNVHNFPNMLFLNKNIKFDFIGNLDNLNFDLPLIMKPYIKDKKLISMIDKETKMYMDDDNNDDDDVEFSNFMYQWFYQSRNRHSAEYLQMFGKSNNNNKGINRKNNRKVDIDSILENYNLEMNDLDDQDIQQLCQIFWIDYLCFPFDLPRQCNLTTLFLQHFGNHVTYRSCDDPN